MPPPPLSPFHGNSHATAQPLHSEAWVSVEFLSAYYGVQELSWGWSGVCVCVFTQDQTKGTCPSNTCVCVCAHDRMHMCVCMSEETKLLQARVKRTVRSDASRYNGGRRQWKLCISYSLFIFTWTLQTSLSDANSALFKKRSNWFTHSTPMNKDTVQTSTALNMYRKWWWTCVSV